MSDRPSIRPVILAGGSGTRLWPLSRGDYPKQLLDIGDGRSLLQATATRLDTLRPEPPLVVAGESLRFLIAHHLSANGGDPGCIVLEPCARNTAPAVAAAAGVARLDGDDPLLVVMPADHAVNDPERFAAAVEIAAVRCAAEPVIATLGITPTRPETGFGYLKAGPALSPAEPVLALERFVEKPDLDTARAWIEAGGYYWNGGVLVARASVLLAAVQRYAPAIAAGTAAAVAAAEPDGCFLRLESGAFAATPSDSFDYAVMEPLSVDARGPFGATIVPLDAGWSDIGSWPALAEVSESDGDGNMTRGDVLLHDSRDSIVIGSSRLVTAIGVRDLIVVETDDAVLVVPRERSQEVRDVVARLAELGREEAERHLRVHRPWGTYERLALAGRYQVKRLTVAPGASLSLQLHHQRAEHWVVVSGTARVTRGDTVVELGPDESTYIPSGLRHRLANPGTEPLEVIEVQSGDYLGEDDIVRFDDDYHRS